MLFAGAIEVPPEVAFMIVAVVVLLALAFAAVGGAIARLVAGERGAFGLGFVTCAATTLLLAQAIPAELAAAAGWAACGGVGLVLRGTQSRN